jgi:hypothetical protein
VINFWSMPKNTPTQEEMQEMIALLLDAAVEIGGRAMLERNPRDGKWQCISCWRRFDTEYDQWIMDPRAHLDDCAWAKNRRVYLMLQEIKDR